MMDWHSIVVGILFLWCVWLEVRLRVIGIVARALAAGIQKGVELMERERRP